MTLGELIHALSCVEPTKKVPRGFHKPHSYRGFYDQLAFEPCGETTVGEMLEAAKSAVGTTYEGWKGGDFVMTKDTDVWIAKQGECGDGIGHLLLFYMTGNATKLCYRCEGKGVVSEKCKNCDGAGKVAL